MVSALCLMMFYNTVKVQGNISNGFKVTERKQVRDGYLGGQREGKQCRLALKWGKNKKQKTTTKKTKTKKTKKKKKQKQKQQQQTNKKINSIAFMRILFAPASELSVL